MEFLAADHPEWMAMWEELSKHSLNEGDPICLFLGQAWEYMGSTADHHHLKHPFHPRTGQAEFAYIERRGASIPWAQAS